MVSRSMSMDLVVGGARVGQEFAPVRLASLGREEPPRDLVAREERGGYPELGPHVGQRRSLGNGECLYPRPAIFDRLSHVPLRPQSSQDLQDDVFGRRPGTQSTLEADPDHLRVGEVECPSRHRHRHIAPAGADGEHPDGAAGGGMAVGADQRLPGTAESLQVHLVADAVAGF